MALVAFIRGLNVGGHRRVRPTVLARQLAHLDAVNVGAAGTLVVRRPVTQAALRAEVARRLPFEADVAICQGREVVALLSREDFGPRPARPGLVRFVSVLSRRTRVTPALPLRLPSSGRWLLQVLAHDGRFIVGVHRREMKVIGCLGELDRLFGAPATTRSWTTMVAVARLLLQTGVPPLGQGSRRVGPRGPAQMVERGR